ncbi:hypothetical protein [Mesorhizobium sp. M0676]|uniref:hypothetical protein n=1 Tax=Mesorhizobium sp. M0676 TaxID=2956984 RepID=UPI00333A0457
MASRLSADGSRVLLVEAGPDTPPNAVPDDILDSDPTRAYFNPDISGHPSKRPWCETAERPSTTSRPASWAAVPA